MPSPLSEWWRSFWAPQLTQAADRYMRSPQFLALMTGNLELMTTWLRLYSRLRLR